MGIRGLGRYIKWKIPGARKTLRLANHTGETWAIDCSCLLYRANGASLSAITVIAALLVRLRKERIRPIIIFDGKTTSAKTDVVEQRRAVRAATHKEMSDLRTEIESGDLTLMEAADAERRCADLKRKAPTVTYGEKDDLKKFLYAAGILFLTASGEADDVLAFLCREKIAQAVVSTDMDMLARGVPTLIVPETNDATVLTEISLPEVLIGLRLQYDQFVDACMLMGSDYSGKGWKGVEPQEAVETARRGVRWDTIDVSGCMMTGVEILKGCGTSWDTILSPKQLAKWSAGNPTVELDNIKALAEMHHWPAEWISVLGQV